MNAQKLIGFLIAFFALLLIPTWSLHSQDEPPSPPGPKTEIERELVIVVGAPGEPKYRDSFDAAAVYWQAHAEKAGIPTRTIGQETDGIEDARTLKETLEEFAENKRELWLILIGHGTYDGRKARFNLRGPDISSQQLAKSLENVKQRIVVINCASCSGPFINALSGPDRVVVTATKSGDQYNATRFGNYVGEAIGSADNDLDKDGQVSLLEAFVAASAATQDFYSADQRLMTENALIDDNGDKLGTPSTWFSGVRATRSAKNAKSPDGRLANQLFLIESESEIKLTEAARKARNDLETKLDSLREQKKELGEAEYLRQIEPLMVKLAKIYQDAD